MSSAAGEASLTREALRERAIRRVVAAFAAVTIGEWLLGTAVAIRAFDLGGAVAVGLVGFRFVPAAIAGLFTASLTAYHSSRTVLVGTAVARACAALGIVLALGQGLPFGVVLAFVWLDAAAGSAYRPAHAVMLPTLVRTPGQLTAATSLVSNAKSTSQLLGALAGGALIGVLEASAAVAVAVGLYLLGAAFAATLAAGAARGSSAALGWQLSQTLAGIRVLHADRVARRIGLWSAMRATVRGIWVSLGVIASIEILGMGGSGFGYLMAAAGAGALIGIALTAMLIGRSRLAPALAAGLVLCGLPLAGVGAASSAVPALTLMVGWGIGMSLSDVGAQALLTRVIGPDSLGAVVGTIESGKLLAEGLGSLLAPLLVELVGLRGALFTAGAVVPVLVVIDLLTGGFRRIDRVAVGRVAILDLIRRVPLFAPLRVDGLESVAAALIPTPARAGERVVRQDVRDDARWYLVESGDFDIDVDGYVVMTARRGDAFGERALLRGAPRSSTDTAVTDGQLLALERTDFLRAVAGPDAVDGFDAVELAPDDPREALARQALLAQCTPAQLTALADTAKERTLRAGELLFRAGDRDDRYCVVLTGELSVIIDGAERRRIGPGESVGEIAVIHENGRTATVEATTRTRLVTVPGELIRAVRG